MKAKVTIEDKQKAAILRQQGLTYAEISNQLGMNLSWCKRHLKDVEVEDPCTMELVQMAIRPEGVSVYEANAIIFKHNKDQAVTKDQLGNARKKAVRADENCVFRPSWLDVTKPIRSYKAMLAYTDHLLDQVDFMVKEYCEEFEGVHPDAVKYELLKYAFPQISPEPLSGRINRTEVLVERMYDRNLSNVSVGAERVGVLADNPEYTTTDLQANLDPVDAFIPLTETELDEIWTPTQCEKLQ